MSDNAPHYADGAPEREALDAMHGPVVVSFGNDWCGHCQAAAPHIAQALEAHPGVAHLSFADSRSLRLGRSFAVKLWPTLVFLLDGKEVARLVRPRSTAPIADALLQIDPAPS